MSTSKRMSRLVMMPTSEPKSSTTGRPEMRNRAHMASTSASVLSGEQVTGSVTMPASERLTISTWPAWSAIERLRCSTPMPPARAMAIAIRASVTVSMAELTSGTCKRIFLVSWLEVSAAAGTTSDAAGSSNTSSKVSPSMAILLGSSPPVRTCSPGMSSRRAESRRCGRCCLRQWSSVGPHQQADQRPHPIGTRPRYLARYLPGCVGWTRARPPSTRPATGPFADDP